MLALCCFAINYLLAQKAFEIKIPEIKVRDCPYNKFQIIDSQANPEDLGFVQTGMLNKYTPVTAKVPLTEQLQVFFDSVIDNDAQSGSLVVQLRNIKFSEQTKSTSEKGFCKIRMSLFEEKGGMLHFVSTIDTLVEVKAMDVTGKLLKEASNVITSTLIQHVFLQAEDYSTPLTKTSLSEIDALEKNSIPLYNTEILPDGVYYDYHTFSRLLPAQTELQFKFGEETGLLKEVKIPNSQKAGKWTKVKPKECYAVVVEGRPYIAAGNRFYSLDHENDDFFIRSSTMGPANTGLQVGLAVGFGLVGAFIGAAVGQGDTVYGIMLVDHLNGSLTFMPDK
ncbi:hypothetical protein D0T57_08865 [Dysgonomonas sp. 511]|nr:hypothetical protein [Dysgonomonas sp. 511]